MKQILEIGKRLMIPLQYLEIDKRLMILSLMGLALSLLYAYEKTGIFIHACLVGYFVFIRNFKVTLLTLILGILIIMHDGYYPGVDLCITILWGYIWCVKLCVEFIIFIIQCLKFIATPVPTNTRRFDRCRVSPV
jgi:hypothetical protein